MNYEQKYKFAIEQAKKELDACDSMNCDAARQIFRLFPELKKSDDERVRENAIQIIRYSMDGTDVALPLSIYKECIAWLEKQGEQSPIEEPKQEWSSKDEDMFTCLWGLLNWAESGPEEYIEWLQSLKQRLNGYE